MDELDIVKHSIDGIAVGALPTTAVREAAETGIVAVDDTIEFEGDDADEADDPDSESTDDDTLYLLFIPAIAR